MSVLECLMADFTVINPEAIPFTLEGRDPKLNPRYAALEICSLLSGAPVDAHQRHTAKGFAAFQNASIQRGNYGVRIRNQLRDFVWKLGVSDPDSRQAVMTIFDGNRDLTDNSFDVPCTLAVQGFLRDSTFYMKTTMRSNDVFLGLPYDLMQFCALQTAMAEILQAGCGYYRHSVGSLHAYVSDIDTIEGLQTPEIETETDQIWAIPDDWKDPLERLEYVIRFCQDALYGSASQPVTDFESWLVESL